MQGSSLMRLKIWYFKKFVVCIFYLVTKKIISKEPPWGWRSSTVWRKEGTPEVAVVDHNQNRLVFDLLPPPPPDRRSLGAAGRERGRKQMSFCWGPPLQLPAFLLFFMVSNSSSPCDHLLRVPIGQDDVHLTPLTDPQELSGRHLDIKLTKCPAWVCPLVCCQAWERLPLV